LILLRQGSNEDAQSSLAKLKRIEPASLRTLELAARLLAARGQGGDSVPPLKTWAEKHFDQTGYVAKLLEELGQYGAALELFERAASGRPERPQAALALAAFLGRRNRVGEALDLCEKVWASCRPDDLAAAIVAVLYSAPVDDAQCRRAAQLIEMELQKSPTAAGLLFHLANIRSLQGRYQDAEALYRQSFAHDQTNSGPLTNLAWLLVRRQGKGTEALTLVTEAIRKDGPTADLLDTRALAYMANGQSDLAIKDLEDALAMHPSPLKHVHLAQAYLMANKRDNASSALEDAKAAGLREDSLSPLERENCQRLVEELAQR
jgi:tetratricopeptide (TPR) repeat protein